MNKPPSDDKRKRTGCGPIVAVALLLFILAVVGYVLSIGPAAYLVDRGIVEEEPLVYFYLPLIGLAEVCHPFEQGIEFYLNLWTE